MTNADRILRRLGERLTAPTDLTLYGRAALSLGFPEPKPEYARSMDVDAVLWIGQADDLLAEGNFWSALDQVNSELAPDGLYMSHLFDETQVVLTPDWRTRRAPIAGSYGMLTLSRLSDADLMLSKMMRYDPVDLEDLVFIVQSGRLDPEAVARAVRDARLPDSEEVREQFDLVQRWMVAQGLCVPATPS